METTALNSMNSQGVHRAAENRLIFKCLLKAKQPLTRLMISEQTGLELPQLCRALYNLTYKLKLLKTSRYSEFQTTDKKVYLYSFIEKLGGC